MYKTIILLLVALTTLLGTSSAWAFRLSVVGTGNMTTQRDNIPPPVAPGTVSYKSELGYGGGALVEVPFMPMVAIEFGGLYYTRKPVIESTFTTVLNGSSLMCFSATGACKVTSVAESKVLEIPITAKFWLTNYFNLGVGVYYAKMLGEFVVTNKVTDANGNDRGSVTSHNAYGDTAVNRETYDYGAVVSLGLNLPLGPMAAFRLDGRYQRGLADVTKDNSQAGNGFAIKNDAFQVLAGLTFGLGK